MQVNSFSLGPLGTNCYIVSHQNSCLIFDPSGEPEVIKQFIEEENLTPQGILLTHAHFDHIGALHELRHTYNVDVYLHPNEKNWLETAELNRSTVFFGENGSIQTEAPDVLLTEGSLTIAPFKFEVIHTPGHSPGSATFIFKEDGFIISGDVLFHNGVGRTDLPEGNMEELAHSISTKLYRLPDETQVYAGHNIPTTIGQEKHENPFTLQFYQP